MLKGILNSERKLTPSLDLIAPSLKLVRENYEALIIITILPALLGSLGSLLLVDNQNLAVVVLALAAIWRAINWPAEYYLKSRVGQRKMPDIKTCYKKGFPFWARIVVFEILFGISLVVGTLLFIIPGLIILRRYFFTPLYIIDKKLSIADAMRLSAKQTKPVSAYVWGTIGVIWLFSLTALIISNIPYVGSILSVFVTLIFFFGPALRWKEISQRDGKKKA